MSEAKSRKGIGGPKPKLTDQLIDDISTYIENGMSNKDAADLCQITDVTLYRWLREADAVDADGKPIAKNKQQRKLRDAIIKARAAFKAFHVQSIIRASRKTWQASAWLLERRFPEEYGSTDRAYAMALQRAAAEVHEDDGLLDALTAVPSGADMIGDVPSDI